MSTSTSRVICTSDAGEELYGPLLTGNLYNPEFEWPGESSSESSLPGALEPKGPKESSGSIVPSIHPSPLLRLLTLQSSLSTLRTHALISPYPSTELGRDNPPPGSGIPRIRLKEMLVSKVHATIYYDESDERKGWCIVDMGSLHGTFLGHSGAGKGEKLSPPRTASLPRALKHLDRLTIGSTTFVVHIHEDGIPCVDCSPTSVNDEIPLFHMAQASQRKHNQIDIWAGAGSRDAKKALSLLKQSLLTSARGIRPQDQPTRYVDRSARRRAFRPDSHPDSPGVSTPTIVTVTRASTPPPSVLVSQPPTPIPKTNIGHRLLLKQGWEPGSSLGLPEVEDGRVRLVEPLQGSLGRHRAGIGAEYTRFGGRGDVAWRKV